MVPWPNNMSLKYWCLRTFIFLSVQRMEIARTSLWGFYCRKGTSWMQITTDWEHLCALKMIKSWRFHFSKQKRSAIGQAVWTLFSYYLVKKYIFWLNSVINNWAKSCLQSFTPIIYPKWTSRFPPCRNLHERSKFFLVVLNTTPALCICRIKHLAQFFFHLISFKELQTSKPRRESWTKVEFDHHPVKEIHRPSMDGNQSWYLETKS